MTMHKHDSAKKDFTHVYENETPNFYYQEFLINLGMVEREEILARYVEGYLLETFRSWAKKLGKPLLVLDFLGCFGNTTLAITNGFRYEDFSKMWACSNCCYKLPKPRQFDCRTWACDISRNACEYGHKAGIYDEYDVIDLNNMPSHQTAALQQRCRSSHILHINSLGYINDHVLTDIIDWFSEGSEPGVFLIGFAYPYNGVERMQQWKKYALSKLDFFSSVPSMSRSLYESEKQAYGPLFGNWSRSYYEMWFLMRKEKEAVVETNGFH